jgi:predicted O-methyltransferase YrrM
VDEALAIRDEIDFSGIRYGTLQDREGKLRADSGGFTEYYAFLAGLIRAQGFKRVIEIGTHMGGSTRAMARGFRRPLDGSEWIITIDPTDLSDGILNSEDLATKVQGIAEAPATVRRVLELTKSAPVDLIFLDGSHDFPSVEKQMRVYSEVFSPRCLIIDDICFNDSMRDLWKDLEATFGDRAANLSDLSTEVRQPRCGFGLLWLSDNPPGT